MNHSHNFSRIFQAQKVSAPRGFQEFPLAGNKEYYLEIGAGKGKHALMFVQQNPKKQLIAVERTKEKFGVFEKKLALLPPHQQANLTAIHADAIAWTVHALLPNSLAGVFLLYPNPEPNNANQRWFNMPFFEFLLSRMQENTSIVLATNIENYVLEAQQQASQVWNLPNELTKVPSGSERTHFEVKYLARGETCWQLTITKPLGYKTRFDSVSFSRNE